jgi:hypothetical protein
MFDPKGIINLRIKQMNLLKMHEIDFRQVMDIFRKYDSGTTVSDSEAGLYEKAIEILRQRNVLDYFLERFGKNPRTTLRPAAAQEEQHAPADAGVAGSPPQEGPLHHNERFSIALTRLDQRECIWLVDVLDKYLKTNRKLDSRISLEFKYIEKHQNSVVGHVHFLAWSSCKLELPVIIEKRNNMLFIQGKGLAVVFDSEGRISVTDTSCLNVLKEGTHQAAAAH